MLLYIYIDYLSVVQVKRRLHAIKTSSLATESCFRARNTLKGMLEKRHLTARIAFLAKNEMHVR